jgi:exopolysaccharide biosynthesis protein
MLELLKTNFKWIAFVVIVLAVTNFLTATHYEGLSKKEKKQIQHQLDSMHERYLAESIIQLANIAKIKEIHRQDSIMNLQAKELARKDQGIIGRQREELNKIKKLNSHEVLARLDSLYETDIDYHN